MINELKNIFGVSKNKELAEILGVTATQVSRWKRGEYPLYLLKLIKELKIKAFIENADSQPELTSQIGDFSERWSISGKCFGVDATLYYDFEVDDLFYDDGGKKDAGEYNWEGALKQVCIC